MIFHKYIKSSKIIQCVILIFIFLEMTFNIDGYITQNIYNKGSNNKKSNLKLRNNFNNIICNEKFIYMKYLIGIRNFKKIYRVIKDNSNIDIQNIINILNYINNTQITNNNYTNSSIFINNSMFDNNTDININNEKIAKTLILSNIYIDVSNIKYIQISTKNDTLIVELDKNNVETIASSNNIHNIMYDVTKIETLISSILLLMKVLNIN
jgi:hypothetical protein